MSTSKFFAGLLAVAAAAAVPAVAQTAQFIPLDAVCGPAFFPIHCVVDMSGDGNTLLFQDKIWTAANGFQPIGGPAGGFQVSALSDDGSTVVGDVAVEGGPYGYLREAAIWRGGNTWQPLGGLAGAEDCGGDLSGAYNVSGDGSKVVGLGWIAPACSGAHAFAWTEQTGMVDLGSIVADRSSRADVISADGTTIAGWSDSARGARLAAQWSNGGPPSWLLGPTSKINLNEAEGISSDGSIIVGGNYGDYTNPRKPGHTMEPWMWTAAGGAVPLGTVKGLRGGIVDGQHYALDVSDDGNVVVGQDTLFNLGEQWAFIWTRTEGMKALQDWLRAHTDAATRALICTAQRSVVSPCSGWDFWNVSAVSNDGKTIVGTGKDPDGYLHAFMIKVQ